MSDNDPRPENTRELANGPPGQAVLATHIVLLSIAAILIAIRVVLRLRVQRGSLLISDALLFLAWGGGVANAAFDGVLYIHGVLEPHVTYSFQGWKPDGPEILQYVLKMVWMSVIPFFLAFYLCKAALLTVYLQLFPVHMRFQRITLYIVIGYVVLAFLASMGTHLFICLPIVANWNILDPTVPECPMGLAATVFRVAWTLHFIGDLMIFALPFTLIYKLQLSTKMKISVYAVLGLGVINIVFSLTRFISIEMSVVTTASSVTLISLWSALDVNIGVIIACLPALRPLLRRNMKSSSAGGYYGGSYGTGTGNKTPARLTAIRHEQGFEVISEPSDGESGAAVRGGPTHIVGGQKALDTNKDGWGRDSRGEKLGTSERH